MTMFIRLNEVDDKGNALMDSIQDPGSKYKFLVNVSDFGRLPGSPFAYWASERAKLAFEQHPPFSSAAFAASGTGTLSDARFLRIWFETPEHSDKWKPYAKGGAFSPIYADVYLSVNWHSDGAEMKASVVHRYGGGHWARNIRSTEHYFRPGLTWPRRTQIGLGMRALPAGCIFADKGPAAFVSGNDPEQLLAVLGLATSAPFRSLVMLQMAFGSYEVGVIQKTPVPDLSQSTKLSDLTRSAWFIKQQLDCANETSHAFVLPRLLLEKSSTTKIDELEKRLKEIEVEIDTEAYRLYGMSPSDCIGPARDADSSFDAADEDSDELQNSDEIAALSWCVGVIFGRFDKRLATAERPLPALLEPFAALPARSPGMVPAGDIASGARNAIAVCDPGHPHDISGQVYALACSLELPCPDPAQLNEWFARDFFQLHLSSYSRSRRKSPLYWHIGTPGLSYSLYICAHNFTVDGFYRLQHDYIAPKIGQHRRQLDALGAAYSNSKEAESLEFKIGELEEFSVEVRRVAPLWNPNWDDGVAVNFAPLWRLVPHHKLWQKELRLTWQSLCQGELDWSQLAMRLWPERVVPKCASDRSLAVAHNLEDLFWFIGEEGKWQARETPLRPLAELVEERVSTAVRDAVKDLLEAPEPVPSSKRSRKSKAS